MNVNSPFCTGVLTALISISLVACSREQASSNVQRESVGIIGELGLRQLAITTPPPKPMVGNAEREPIVLEVELDAKRMKLRVVRSLHIDPSIQLRNLENAIGSWTFEEDKVRSYRREVLRSRITFYSHQGSDGLVYFHNPQDVKSGHLFVIKEK